MKRRFLLITVFLLICSFIQAETQTIELYQSFFKDTLLHVFNSSKPISSASVTLSVNGKTSFSFFRVLLVDNAGHKYLLAESYKEIADNNNVAKQYADETEALDNITPAFIEIYARDIIVNVHKVDVTLCSESKNIFNTKETKLDRSKVQEKVNKINQYNNTHEKLWTAGVTELGLLPFEERMRILGFSPSDDTGGFEYYVDGIFEVGERDEYTQDPPISISFVDQFDWTDRHGKNWMTSVKGQGHSNYCVAFASIACAEALTNLYYNKKIDLDLSELEAANCCSNMTNPYQNGLYISSVALYLGTTGVCDEASYPFLDSPNDTLCRSDQINPQYRLKTSGYWSCPSQYHKEDSIKKILIKNGPLLSGFSVMKDLANNNQRRSHVMALVGFGTIHAGDSVRQIIYVNDSSTLTTYYVVPDTSQLIGRTYFKFKNSNNIRPNDDVDGYMHLLFHNISNLSGCKRLLYPFTITSCPTDQPLYTESDVVCEDSDGDGYYFWGLGSKPAYCPTWVPDSPDGDDSDYAQGELYLEKPNVIGDTMPLDPDGNPTIQITGNTIYNTRQFKYNHIRIASNATLKVKDILNLFGRVTITIESGGELIIDGGTITNAYISFATGGKLTIKNGGKLVMRTNTDFEAPVGALVEVENGEICKSNDF